jgi:multiple sugar transport system permease protein
MNDTPDAPTTQLLEFTRGRSRTDPLVLTWVKRGLIYILLMAGAVIAIYPFLWMLSSSFKPLNEILSLPPSLIPTRPQVANYVDTFAHTEVLIWFLNSIIVVLLRLTASLFLCALAGFAFAKYDFPLKKALFVTMLGTMMLPVQVFIVPLFILMTRIGWVNTYQALIVPWVATPLGIFLMRQYMLTIPNELLDAARIDGANELRIFFRIALPLSRPGLASLGVVLFLFTWTSFLWPIIVLTTRNHFTLPIGLANLFSATSDYATFWGRLMVTSVFASFPAVLLFFLLQRHFVRGLGAGAIKQ